EQASEGGRGRPGEPWVNRRASRSPGSSAGFPTCCIAGFLTCETQPRGPILEGTRAARQPAPARKTPSLALATPRRLENRLENLRYDPGRAACVKCPG